jgi:hypothetical protein
VPWARRLTAGLPLRRAGFDPGSVHLGFEVGKVALGQVFSRVFRSSLVIFIPVVLNYWQKDKQNIMVIILVIGLHKKP